MQISVRSYLTAGVAMFGASAIALAPVQALPADAATTAHAASSQSVALTAGFDPITPWLEVWNNSKANVAALVNAYLEAPFPITRQVIANQLLYLSELPDIGLIVDQIVANLGAAIEAPFAEDTSTLDEAHAAIYDILVNGLQIEFPPPIPPIVIIPPIIPEDLQPLVALTTTYLSGALLGLVGPVIGPLIVLAAGVEGIVENLFGEQPDFAAALNDLVDIPANMTNAFLNGGTVLNLAPLIGLLNIDLPDGVDSVGIAMGGLLSPGGSLFNAVDISASLPDLPPIVLPGQGPGLIGSLIGLDQLIGKAIGGDGQGNPLQPADLVDDEESGDSASDVMRSSISESPAEFDSLSVQTLDEDPATDPLPGGQDESAGGGSEGSAQGTGDDESGNDELAGDELGSDESRSDESGGDELGGDESGGDELAGDESGDELGSDESGDESGSDESGNDTKPGNDDSGNDAGDHESGDGGNATAA